MHHNGNHFLYPPITKYEKEETLIFSFSKRTFRKTVIALGSIEHGTGLTSISLALSNYLCSKAGKKTAYIELNASNEIRALSGKRNNEVFSHMGITFFPHRTFTSLAEILCMDYDYFILDMGVLNSCSVKEFCRFEKQFLVCSLSEWKIQKTTEKLNALLKEKHPALTRMIILGNCSKKESTLKVSPTMVFRVLSTPFITNPFQLNPEFFTSFGKILGQY